MPTTLEMSATTLVNEDRRSDEVRATIPCRYVNVSAVGGDRGKDMKHADILQMSRNRTAVMFKCSNENTLHSRKHARTHG